MAVGATPADIDALAEPIDDRLFFAGEATYRHHWATTHGAYVSGLREAARICRRSQHPSAAPLHENRRWRRSMLRASRFFNVAQYIPQRADQRKRGRARSRAWSFPGCPSPELSCSP